MSDEERRQRGTKDSEVMRQALKRAAMRVFAEQGFEGARAEQIAAAANANKAMINYHFGGKKGLYDTVLREALLPARDAVRELLEQDLPAEELLRRFIRALSQRMTANPALAPAIVREAMSGGRHLEEPFVPIVVELFGSLATIIERGLREGAFRDVDPFRTHLAIIGPIAFFHATRPFRERLISEEKIPTEPIPDDEFADHVADLVLDGLKGESGTDPERRQGATP
jgi:TetR/AcrR family transcriptional regulator